MEIFLDFFYAQERTLRIPITILGHIYIFELHGCLNFAFDIKTHSSFIYYIYPSQLNLDLIVHCKNSLENMQRWLIFSFFSFQIPEHFLPVVKIAFCEFFNAIQHGKDAESSWKKQIYKIIQRYDEPIPEYFKTPEFLKQLE